MGWVVKALPRPGRLAPERETWYAFERGWVGPSVSLDGCGKSHP